MGKKVSYTNQTKNIQHVGPKTIWPGDTREVDEDDLTKAHGVKKAESKKEASPPADPLLALLDNSVSDIIKVLAERNVDGVPMISDEDINKLIEAENNGKTRSTALEAFEAERLMRAQDDTETTPPTDEEMEAFANTLKEMSEDELTNQLEVYADNELMLGAVNAEIDRRSET